MPLKQSFKTEQYSLSSNTKQPQNAPNFITIPTSRESGNGAWLRLAKISEEDKIEIIKLGFQLQAEVKISLKKYYESTQEYSSFQLKGYNIKYETIRRTKLYQQFKE